MQIMYNAYNSNGTIMHSVGVGVMHMGWHEGCGRGLNSIQRIEVISNNTKYKKYIKSRCILQPYSWQGIS